MYIPCASLCVHIDRTHPPGSDFSFLLYFFSMYHNACHRHAGKARRGVKLTYMYHNVSSIPFSCNNTSPSIPHHSLQSSHVSLRKCTDRNAFPSHTHASSSISLHLSIASSCSSIDVLWSPLQREALERHTNVVVDEEHHDM